MMPAYPSSFALMERSVPTNMYRDQYSLGQPMMELPSMEEAIAEYHMAQMVFEARMQARARMSNFFRQRQQQQQRLRQLSPPAPLSPMMMTRPVPVSPLNNRPRLPAAPGLELLRRVSTTMITDDSSAGDRSEMSSLDGSSGSKRVDSDAVPHNMVYVDTIRDTDVLCGRGGRSNHHPGNKRYRCVVSEMKSAYQMQEAKCNKTDLSRSIVDHVCQYGGRFIKKESTGRYYVLTRGEARKKTSQALRETKVLKWTK